MDTFVLLAVLAAAALHAGWNALVKIGLDRFSSVLLLTLFTGAIAVVLLPFFPSPARAAWPWLVASGLLHSGYKFFLIRAYVHGDLSQVYPLARGSAPLIVGLVGVIALGEAMTPAKGLGVAAIGFGVIAMSLRGGASLHALPRMALIYALATACFTASYTLVDGVGSRASGSASSYTLWLFIGDTVGMTTYALASRGPKAFLALTPAWRSGLAAGAMSLGSYWIAIWAFTVAPIALVAALRETSVLFAMLIAVVMLGERPGRWRWIGSALILAGVILIRL
jgi:drug/metabolite transporter (DMT)-like permease